MKTLTKKLSLLALLLVGLVASFTTLTNAETFDPEKNTLGTFDAPSREGVRDIKYSERKQLYKLLKWDKDCEQAYDDTQYDHEVDPNAYAMAHAYPLSQTQQLLEIQCYLGAYQGEYLYIIHNTATKSYKTPPKAVRVETSPKRYETRVGGLPEFNPKTMTVDTIVKGRGLGDYGESYVWKLMPLQNELSLVEKRVMTYEKSSQLFAQCEKAHPKDAEDVCFERVMPSKWPVVYKRKGS